MGHTEYGVAYIQYKHSYHGMILLFQSTQLIFIGHDTLQHTCLNNYNKLDARSQYRFLYHPTGTGVSYRWYLSFTYVVLECYLCGTDKELKTRILYTSILNLY